MIILSQCESEHCSWPLLHSSKSNILEGKFPNKDKTTNINDHKISSDEGESIYFLRSIRRMLDANSTLSFENQVDNHLKKFATNLYKHLTQVFTSKDKYVIETSRTVTDWISLAIQLKSKSVAKLSQSQANPSWAEVSLIFSFSRPAISSRILMG